MPAIRVLAETVINKIAAGEVVERPASVVKELIENAIDAGGDEIVMTVRSGGKSLIQVIDNGRGMLPEDARLCFERHATSKISTWEDLQAVRSFGFRGEALASIASVSDVELKTRAEEEDTATVIRIHGGVVAETTRMAALRGTTVTVKSLFYNVPARRQFLKTNNTEFRHMAGMIKKFAMAYPAIEFTLINEDDKVFQLRKTDLAGRMDKLIGREIMAHSLHVDKELHGRRVHGYVSKPSFSFKTQGDQFLFINGRPIFNRTVLSAVSGAFGHTLPRGDRPFFVLFLEWDPSDFDVNVHPTKAEVKFKDEQLLYRLVYHALVDAMNTDSTIPSLGPTLVPPATPTGDEQGALGLPPVGHTFSAHTIRTAADHPATDGQRTDDRRFIQRQLVQTQSVSPSSLVWQLHNRYIISQIKSGLAIIDQHVAHERILYERALEAFERNPIFSQQLLFPQTLEFTAEDFAIIEEMMPLVGKLGFVVKVFGKRTIVVEAVPADVRLGNEEKILQEMIDTYKESEHTNLDPRDNLAKSFACRSAIKSGDPLTVDEMNGLIDQLFATKFPYVCPHGRPVIIQLSLDELDKRFMRIS